MLNEFSRTELLIGKKESTCQNLYGKACSFTTPVSFGIGGVGGYVVEALARSGVGAFDLIDDDKVCLTNINRQIIATRKTIGKYKVDVMEERVHLINPEAQVTVHKCFYLPETADQFDFTQYDYVVDAVDTVTAKLEIIMRAKEAGVPCYQLYGSRQQIRPHAVPCGGYLQDYHVPFGEGHAQRTEKTRCEEAEGGVFYGKPGEAAGKYGKQLQDRLCLSSGYTVINARTEEPSPAVFHLYRP